MDAIWAETPDGVITSWNPAAEAIYGYDANHMVGRTADALVPAERRGEHAEIRARVRGGQPVAHYQTVHVAADGRRLDVSLAVSAILGGEGEPAGLAVIARDISEAAATARELERSNAELEQFAYVVSHDLTEPLRAITGFLQMLERRHGALLDDDGRRYIRRSLEGSVRMRGLLGDLLAFSRVRHDPVPMAAVALDDVMASVLESLDAILRETQAVVERDPLPRVCGNAGQLGQLLQNLLANALKFHGPTPPHIEIRAERTPEGEHRISVLDDGIGIDARFTERVFRVFKRLNARDAYPGTGIGLAICKRIVENHGGRIWCEPRAEQGAAFHFTLPPVPEH